MLACKRFLKKVSQICTKIPRESTSSLWSLEGLFDSPPSSADNSIWVKKVPLKDSQFWFGLEPTLTTPKRSPSTRKLKGRGSRSNSREVPRVSWRSYPRSTRRGSSLAPMVGLAVQQKPGRKSQLTNGPMASMTSINLVRIKISIALW